MFHWWDFFLSLIIIIILACECAIDLTCVNHIMIIVVIIIQWLNLLDIDIIHAESIKSDSRDYYLCSGSGKGDFFLCDVIAYWAVM